MCIRDRGRFVLFATDGEPNCAGGVPDASSATETVAAVTALASAGIKTYVLGFGGGFTDDSVLRNSAIAGGVPRAGNTPYYVANDAAQLDAVLSQIAGGLIIPSCSYALASPPPDPDLVNTQRYLLQLVHQLEGLREAVHRMALAQYGPFADLPEDLTGPLPQPPWPRAIDTEENDEEEQE